jgi:hypothetical protein
MAQESGFVQRGLLLLGLMLAIAAVVGFILFRPKNTPPEVDSTQPALVALAVAIPGEGFPASTNWGALAALGHNLPSSPGWQVRYNATIALARRGSTQLPFDVLCQMLDEEQQVRNFRMAIAPGKEIADEYAARRTVLDALKAFEDWQKHKEAVQAARDNPGLACVHAAIDKLTKSDNEVLRTEAQIVKKTFAPT